MKDLFYLFLIIAFVATSAAAVFAQDDATTKVLKSGLVGAGTGALAAGMSGGKAGKGALIGAGTSVIGNVLLDAITGSGSRSRSRDDYEPYDDLDDYYEYEEPAEDATQKVLKDGLIGAGTGAIAAGVSGGKAGQGALIGAGTNVIGSALLDTITKSGSERKGRRYRRAKKSAEPRYKIIRKYDDEGNLIAEELIPLDE